MASSSPTAFVFRLWMYVLLNGGMSVLTTNTISNLTPTTTAKLIFSIMGKHGAPMFLHSILWITKNCTKYYYNLWKYLRVEVRWNISLFCAFAIDDCAHVDGKERGEERPTEQRSELRYLEFLLFAVNLRYRGLPSCVYGNQMPKCSIFSCELRGVGRQRIEFLIIRFIVTSAPQLIHQQNSSPSRRGFYKLVSRKRDAISKIHVGAGCMWVVRILCTLSSQHENILHVHMRCVCVYAMDQYRTTQPPPITQICF